MSDIKKVKIFGTTYNIADGRVDNIEGEIDAVNDRVDEQNLNIATFGVETNGKINNFKASVNDTIRNFTTDANADIATIQNNVNTYNSNHTSAESTLSSRIDSFTRLAAGSTTGDAELIDARTPISQIHGGVAYSTAGDAIRGQAAILLDKFKNMFSLDSDDATVLANGTDFNTITTKGNYKVSTYASACSMTNIPNLNAGRLVVMYTSQSDRFYQFYFPNTSTPGYIFYRVKHNATSWTNWFHLNVSESAVIPETTKLRILSYNIGGYNYGHDGGLSTNVPQKIANYKKFFGEVNPDFACINEQTDYIDANNMYEAEATLFDDLFANKTLVKNHIQVLGNRYFDSETNLNLKDSADTDYGCFANIYFTTVNKIKVPIVCLINRALATKAIRLSAFDALLQWLHDNYNSYSVICGDFNPTDADEYNQYITKMEAAGFSVGNGGYFGEFVTYHGSGYNKLDNVAVKGGKLKNFYVPNVYDDLSSDHYPVVADIEFNI